MKLGRALKQRAILDRFRAANTLWWGFDLAAWDLTGKHYRAGQGHPPHQDITPGVGCVRRRLPGMIQLSDPATYNGGHLRIRFAHHIVAMPRERGSLITMPAWTIHEVTPLTAGERYVLLVDADGT
jgi:PKHD-type hydroxylase